MRGIFPPSEEDPLPGVFRWREFWNHLHTSIVVIEVNTNLLVVLRLEVASLLESGSSYSHTPGPPPPLSHIVFSCVKISSGWVSSACSHFSELQSSAEQESF